MSTVAHNAGVVHYYDTHPINEHEILRKVAAKGLDVETLTENELKEFDQDHYGGFDATDTLASAADICRDHAVLDVCSGLGGPARWLAYRIGCHVTGLDLTGSRVASARRLTECVGLASLVDFVRGDATLMPLGDAIFDRVISQEAWVHIDDKRALLSECRRVLKPSGILAFTDIISCLPLTSEESSQMADEMQFPSIVTAQRYLDLLPQVGFSVERYDDLSSGWRDILVSRLEMYRSLRDTTVERFGEAHFEKWDRMYSAFVALYVAGKLGGARIVARGAGVRPGTVNSADFSISKRQSVCWAGLPLAVREPLLQNVRELTSHPPDPFTVLGLTPFHGSRPDPFCFCGGRNETAFPDFGGHSCCSFAPVPGSRAAACG